MSVNAIGSVNSNSSSNSIHSANRVEYKRPEFEEDNIFNGNFNSIAFDKNLFEDTTGELASNEVKGADFQDTTGQLASNVKELDFEDTAGQLAHQGGFNLVA